MDAELPVTVDPSAVRRAARLAGVITADPHATHHGDGAWTAADVINVALGRGLDALEQQYLTK
jgi:hypothetical protein